MPRAVLVAAIGRGHALAKKFHQSGVELHSLMPFHNPGIAACSTSFQIGNINDPAAVAAFAEKIDPDYVFVAGDDPIAAGAADAVIEKGFDAIAPLKSVARLESDKVFARQFMQEYVPDGTPVFQTFTDADEAQQYIDSVPFDVVVKPSGLTGGKGVKVQGVQLKDKAEAKAYAAESLRTYAGGVVVEEKLDGEEFSLHAFVDGEHFATMPLVQDHKTAFDGDTGPMTGGMGTFTEPDGRLPFVSESDYQTALSIVQRTIDGVKEKTGLKYKGILYAQFMLTAKGPMLIEYNVRFGDPEAMNLLPLLKTNFHDVCSAIVDEELEGFKVEFEPRASICKYVVPTGYPERKEQFAFSIDESKLGDVDLYYSGVEKKPDGTLWTTGSRGFGLVSTDVALQGAYDKAESVIAGLGLKGFRYRKDIGSEESIRRKVERMQRIRLGNAAVRKEQVAQNP
ncbi:phosphoribosylamine--glycine ligase [Candidatus Micrarchaeota archaeon]|nr:phosphoribosylamine--glycine ligase [Candidatus Micrarchaeota archaeon]